MKFIITILLLVIGASAQNDTTWHDVCTLHPDIDKNLPECELEFNDEYKDGSICYCDSVSIDVDTTLGTWETYTPYKHGKINGVQYTYIIDAEQIILTEYVNGIESGIYKNFTNCVNKITDECTLYESGVLINGKLKERTEYRDNGSVLWTKINNTEKWYFENGKLAGTATYKNGKLVGYKKCTDGRFGNESLNCLN